jgi:hypothetical protein
LKNVITKEEFIIIKVDISDGGSISLILIII